MDDRRRTIVHRPSSIVHRPLFLPMTDLNDKVTIIIRSVGERTEQLCRELILAQGIAPANVVIVHEAPFSAAMRKSFEIGIERGLPWTFCVDADVLLRPGSVETMVSLAEEQAENVCEIQGYILDKFFGGPRHGGVHLYRTALLPKVIDCIPAEGVNVRPERHTLYAMKAQGHPWVSVPYLVGLHDFEQYYRDIFRKCFVQAHKHLYRAELLITFWRDLAMQEMDYAVALQGFARGVTHYDAVLIDVNVAAYQETFAELGIQEKEELAQDAHSLDSIEKICKNWVEPELYYRFFPRMDFMDKKNGKNSNRQEAMSLYKRFAEASSQIGPHRSIVYAVGWFLSKTGATLKGWSGFKQQ